MESIAKCFIEDTSYFDTIKGFECNANLFKIPQMVKPLIDVNQFISEIIKFQFITDC